MRPDGATIRTGGRRGTQTWIWRTSRCFKERRADIKERVDRWWQTLSDNALTTAVAEVAGGHGLVRFAIVGPPRLDEAVA